MTLKFSTYGFLFQVFFMSMLMANTGNAQYKNTNEIFIKEAVTGHTVKEVFKLIEANSDFEIFFIKRDLKSKKEIHLKPESGRSVYDILIEISKQTGLKFRQVNNVISATPISKEELKGDMKRVEVLADVDISGKITDENGEGLPGATVVEKGTTNGTTTDLDGNYKLKTSEEAIIAISFVGYVTQEILVGAQSTIDIQMEVDAQQLEELVVIGYGTMKKSDLTGSVIRLKNTEEMNQLPNVSIVETLHGRIAGVNVGAVNSAGEEPSLDIRGYSTLSTGSSANAPLIVMDGVIYRGAMIDINTMDIETIDILKDASSAAIYGSQASNGVIIITTKRGTSTEKPVFNYTTSFTLQVPSNDVVPMGRKELDNFITDTSWENGSRLAPDYLQPNPDFVFYNNLKSAELSEGYLAGLENDWWNDFTGNGQIQSHNLSLQGATENLRYFVSAGLKDVQGYLKNDKYKRNNFRVNLDADVNNWLSIGMQSFLALSDYSGVAPSAASLFKTQPWAPIYDADREYLLTPDGSALNPHLTAQIDDDDRRLNGNINLYANIQVPFINGLSYKINYANNYTANFDNQFNPWGASFQGHGYKNSSEYHLWSVDNIVSYDKTIDEHKINFNFVYGLEEIKYQNTNASSSRYGIKDLGYYKLEAGEQTSFAINSGGGEQLSLYTSARLFYSLKDKYMLTGTIRRDGFSGFGSGKKIGLFPSVALAWVASEEAFLDSDWLDYLKLRGFYGQSGRRAVSPYQTKATVAIAPRYVFGDGADASMGQWIGRMANNELTWETTTGINIGADFGFFDGKLSGNIEYYSNNTKDILYNIQLPWLTGFSNIADNVSKVKNHGIELVLSGNIINTNDIRWDASFNFSRNRNEIVSLLGEDNDGDGKEDDLVSNRLFIGEPQNVIFDYEITGEMWQLADRDEGTIPSGFFPGTLKLVDQNNDDAISASDDKIIQGYADPSYRFGISNTLKYKNLSLYVFINSVQGGKDYYKAIVYTRSLSDLRNYARIHILWYDIIYRRRERSNFFYAT